MRYSIFRNNSITTVNGDELFDPNCLYIEDDSNTSVYINKCRSRRGWIDKARIIKIEEYLDSKQ